MNVLVNGCSFSRGPGSWPYLIKASNLVNLALAGAGNSYIQEATIYELSQRKYDYVLIMWSGLSRIDFKVEDITQFDQSKFTSKFQKTRNDWTDKIVCPINDQDYIENNWVFGDAIINQEACPAIKSFLAGIYRQLGHTEFIYHFLQKVVALQSFLKYNNIPYLFAFYKNYLNQLESHPLYNLLDKSNIMSDTTIADIAASINDYAEDKLHPGLIAHQRWADLVNKRLYG